MALSNLDKNTLTNLFNMINSNDEDKLLKVMADSIKNDYSTYSKLKMIYTQINLLKEESTKIFNNHLLNKEISALECSFKKTPGTHYYVYKKDRTYLSMIPPDKWWGNPGILIMKVYYDLCFYTK